MRWQGYRVTAVQQLQKFTMHQASLRQCTQIAAYWELLGLGNTINSPAGGS